MRLCQDDISYQNHSLESNLVTIYSDTQVPVLHGSALYNPIGLHLVPFQAFLAAGCTPHCHQMPLEWKI